MLSCGDKTVLHATNLWDFSADKRLALLVRLIQSAQIPTGDEILQMFIKRMSRITARAKEELERVRTEERDMAEHLVEDTVRKSNTILR